MRVMMMCIIHEYVQSVYCTNRSLKRALKHALMSNASSEHIHLLHCWCLQARVGARVAAHGLYGVVAASGRASEVNRGCKRTVVNANIVPEYALVLSIHLVSSHIITRHALQRIHPRITPRLTCGRGRGGWRPPKLVH